MDQETKLFFRWTNEYSVNIQQIDNQHKGLFEIINKLYNAFSQKKANEQLNGIIDELIQYAVNHFATEEKYFKEFGYENTADHMQKHKEFFEKMKEFQANKDKKQLLVTYQLMSFLRNWLIDHILHEDVDYKDCFIKNGLK
jgi:hemerythrin-like metal-binding protein